MTFINKITDYFIGTDAHKDYAGFRDFYNTTGKYFSNKLETEPNKKLRKELTYIIKYFKEEKFNLYFDELIDNIFSKLMPNCVLYFSFQALYNNEKAGFAFLLVVAELSRIMITLECKNWRTKLKEECNILKDEFNKIKEKHLSETKKNHEPNLEFKLDLDGCDYLTEEDFRRK